MTDRYTHGHQEAVLRSHRWRTAENSAGYLLSSLRAGLDLLDIGCGPGTITADLARRVSPGRVLGIDVSAAVIDEAGRDHPGIEFRVDDVYGLDLPSGSFDIVHAHQVLQHLSRPVDALTEARRVLRPGGLLAVRDSDYAAFAWAPRLPLLDRWQTLYHQVTAANGAEADAGRHLRRWVNAAGFTDVEVSSSNWTFAERDTTTWWGDLWADRCRSSSFAAQAISEGFTDVDELSAIADAWRTWARDRDATFIVVHGEVLARAPVTS